jgi:hypothetical protein
MAPLRLGMVRTLFSARHMSVMDDVFACKTQLVCWRVEESDEPGTDFEVEGIKDSQLRITLCPSKATLQPSLPCAEQSS